MTRSKGSNAHLAFLGFKEIKALSIVNGSRVKIESPDASPSQYDEASFMVAGIDARSMEGQSSGENTTYFYFKVRKE